ncbi:MAG: photosystem II oxygen evolving complex protein PsbP [Leptolyngbya sp. DLM2.Bin15]|nr:MAG: photosystem II oxygen evolving complex protein PsbP [Leptolyngbya sp. DLM2.Bin15]
MLKRMALLLLVIVSLGLQSCVSAGAGLNSYIDSYDGYEFFYPNGWVETKVENGPDIVFHDIIQESENVSVVISPIPEGQSLRDLGTPTDVGQRLAQKVITSAGSDRKAELVGAAERDLDGELYYLLEYAVELPTQNRHNLASVVVRRGKLFTLNASTTEDRWDKMRDTFRQVVASFKAY